VSWRRTPRHGPQQGDLHAEPSIDTDPFVPRGPALPFERAKSRWRSSFRCC
jgi:hypothetical protein